MICVPDIDRHSTKSGKDFMHSLNLRKGNSSTDSEWNDKSETHSLIKKYLSLIS